MKPFTERIITHTAFLHPPICPCCYSYARFIADVPKRGYSMLEASQLRSAGQVEALINKASVLYLSCSAGREVCKEWLLAVKVRLKNVRYREFSIVQCCNKDTGV